MWRKPLSTICCRNPRHPEPGSRWRSMLMKKPRSRGAFSSAIPAPGSVVFDVVLHVAGHALEHAVRRTMAVVGSVGIGVHVEDLAGGGIEQTHRDGGPLLAPPT